MSMKAITDFSADVVTPEKIDILIVDDHPANLFALEALLDEADYHLVRAGSGEAALRLVLERDFALILLDVQMPGIDGFETAKLIRKRRRSALTPIIFLTATSVNEKQISRGYALGAVDYIYKPIIPENLKAKVSVFAALHRNSRELARSKEALRLELEARKQADLAQRESEAMYRKLFSHASDAIVVFDDQSDTVLEVNKAAVELYGYTEADFLRLSSKDLEAKPLGAGAQPEKAYKKTMMRSQIKADGRDFLAEVTSASITLKGKKLTMMLARDVTARQKAADAALIRSREIALRPFRPKGSKFTVF